MSEALELEEQDTCSVCPTAATKPAAPGRPQRGLASLTRKSLLKPRVLLQHEISHPAISLSLLTSVIAKRPTRAD